MTRNLNPHQFGEIEGQLELFDAGPADPDTRKPRPPSGYYKQQKHEQMALPGMEMTPQQHAAAAGASFETDILPSEDKKVYKSETGITLGPGPHLFRLASMDGHLDWTSGDFPETDLPEHPGYFEERAGEIQMVQSDKRGTAARLHATARRIAEENADIPMPKHSQHRTPGGVQWSRKEMRKYGEEEW